MATLTNTKIKDTYDGLLKTTDNEALDVSGVTLIEDGLGNASALSVGRSGNGVSVSGNLAVDTNTLYVDAANNRVGVGTSSPNQKIELMGNNAYDSKLRFSYGSGATDYFADWGYKESGEGNKVFLTITDAGVSRDVLSANYNGNVGINCSPNAKLQVVGSVQDQMRFGSNTSVYTDLWMGTGYTVFDSIGGNSGAFDFRDDGVSRMFIDSSGNVGIGASSVVGGSKLHISSANGTAYTSNAQLRISGASTNNNRAQILFSDDALSDGKLSYYPASGTAAYFSLSARNTESDFILNASGNVGIGTATIQQSAANRTVTTINGTTSAILNLAVSDTLKSYLYADTSGGVYETSGNNVIVAGGANYIGLNTNGSERMRIDSSGNTYVNYSNTAINSYGGGAYGGKSVIKASAANALCLMNEAIGGSTQVALNFTNEFASSQYNYLGRIIVEPEQSWTTNAATRDSRMSFFTTQNGATGERIRITSGGLVNIGDATSSGVGRVNISANPANNYQIEFFTSAGTSVGSITTSGGTTTNYNTSSDYRLKEDLQPIATPLDRVDALNPVNFAWKTDGSRVDGFIAHELSEVIPEAVTGEKDAVDEEGNPIYQGIDQSKIVPLLVGAIKELRAEIELLKNA